MLKAGLLPDPRATRTDPEAGLKNGSISRLESDRYVRNDRCKRTMVATLICSAIFVVGMALPYFMGRKCPIGPFIGVTDPHREVIDLGGRNQTIVVHHPQLGREKEGRVSSPSIVVDPTDPMILIASSDRVSEPTVDISRSHDGGVTWVLVSVVKEAYWSTLFFHRGSLYLLGPSKEYGDMRIRRSEDLGTTWTRPASSSSGRLTDGQRWHRSAVPVIGHHGRLWHAAEALDAQENLVHGLATMWSADEGSDLLDASSWHRSNNLAFPTDGISSLPLAPRTPSLTPSTWLEGNAVISPSGKGLAILMRVESPDGGNAGRVNVDEETLEATFDSFVSFPGGAKKFMIQHDPESGRYVALSNVLVVPSNTTASSAEFSPEDDVWLQLPMSVFKAEDNMESKRYIKAGDRRNALALVSSSDLNDWVVHEVLFYEDDLKVGMQYPGFAISGDDILLVLRTAAPYQQDDPLRSVAANLMTFYRLEDFRSLLSREVHVKIEQEM